MGLISCFLGALSYGLLRCASEFAERKNCQASILMVLLFGWAMLVMLGCSAVQPSALSLPWKAVVVAAVGEFCSRLKDDEVDGKTGAQFRFEGFNILNHPVLRLSYSQLDSYSEFDSNGRPLPQPLSNSLIGAFGTITNTAIDNRQLQCALKLLWW